MNWRIGRTVFCGLLLMALLGAACGGEEFANSLGMKMVRIGPGTFMMGADSTPLPDEILTMKSRPSGYHKSRLKPPVHWKRYRQGLFGVLYGRGDFTGAFEQHLMEKIEFEPGANARSARLRGYIKAPQTGLTSFLTGGRSGLRLLVSGRLIVDTTGDNTQVGGQVRMIEGQMVPVVLEYIRPEKGGRTSLMWNWINHRGGTPIPADVLWHSAAEYNVTIAELAWLEAGGKKIERFKWGDHDEHPTHEVTITQPFYMSETEVTVEQFRQFRADYAPWAPWINFAKSGMENRGPNPYVYATRISWRDAVAFCEWLSEKEGKPYRLATEAEWEYACRAGAETMFWSGDSAPEPGTANPWGLKNMHSGPLEWCFDWYGPYPEGPATDPVGPDRGWTKVVRGGGLDTMDSYYAGTVDLFGPRALGINPYYRRSANRASAAPDLSPPPQEYQDKQVVGFNQPVRRPPCRPPFRAGGLIPGLHKIGFRVVQAPMPQTKHRPLERPFFQRCVKQTAVNIEQGPDPGKSYYRSRLMFPDLGDKSMVEVGWQIGIAPGHGTNHHNSALASLGNGDLLAFYYNGFTEDNPDQSIAALRLRCGSEHWGPASPWPNFADASDAAPIVWNDGGTVWLFWGCPRLDGGYPFQFVKSTDNGATWSEVRFPLFESRIGHHSPQPINSAFRDSRGVIYVGVDGGTGTSSELFASDNNGRTWYDTGGRTLGRHSTFVTTNDGGILAYGGKNVHLDGYMPINVSSDGGKTWEVSRSPMPSLGGGQRPSLIRLASGRLFYVGGSRQGREDRVPKRYLGKRYGVVALSDDDGRNWIMRKLVGGQIRDEAGESIEVGGVGYVTACQAANGIIHVVTSHPSRHFELNEAWLLEGAGDSMDYGDTVNMVPGSVSQYRENYPSGKLKATWSAGSGDDGRYLLDGTETWYYENGQKQWEVTYRSGRKIGIETYYNVDGGKEWKWSRTEEGTGVWTVWRRDGNLKAVSRWRGNKLLSYELGG